MMKTAEMAQVCYHKIKRNQEDVNAFALGRVSDVACRPNAAQGEQGVATCSSFGAFLPNVRVWNTDWCKSAWVCKWQQHGLMPVRPLVVTTKVVELPPKKALLFN